MGTFRTDEFRRNALPNRECRAAGRAPINRKRVTRNPGRYGLTLERCTSQWRKRTQDGKMAVITSNLRSPAWTNGVSLAHCLDGVGIV